MDFLKWGHPCFPSTHRVISPWGRGGCKEGSSPGLPRREVTSSSPEAGELVFVGI
ncbi:unnamed protein product [Nyctereutes procyonoides]|uniref:(raccoon dog) hypothetical protein n=1 Tax=Nyctereutes procyonoides TaxID=34880 RepID=A0A811Y1L0_NYCPR|nr:unnamed protein product [Nyctereutes procyonoides]